MKRSIRLFVALGFTTLAIGYFMLEANTNAAPRDRVIANRADEIFRSPTSVVAGNPQGDVSIVAFFDYNCPYCRKHVPALRKLIEGDPNLRLVLKELPVLGPNSEDATRVVLAAKKQGKYLDLYWRLLGGRGQATRERALAVAAEIGLDMDRLKDDMDDPEITATILDNMRLGSALGVKGVPFYLVGDQVLKTGDRDFYTVVAERVAEVRKNGCSAAC